MSKVKIIALLVVVFITAVAVWYSPVLFKGYSTLISRDALLLARNHAQNNVLGMENELNVVLPSSLVKEQAEKPIGTSGKLTPLFLSGIFKVFGLPEYENLVFVPIVLLALALLIFTVTAYYLFDFKTAAIFSFMYILLPFNWWFGSYNFGTYEVSILFFALFSLFFVLGLKSEWKPIFLVLSGLFLALSGIAKEAMWMIVPVLFFHLFFKKQKKQLLYVFIPFFIIILAFWLPDMFQGRNAYNLFFSNELEERSNFLDFGFYSHFFPDPYTYHFNREDYLNSFKLDIESSDLELITKIKMAKTAGNMGFKSPSLMDRLKIGTTNLIRHLSRFLAIEDIGGPFIFLLLVLGFIYLRKEENYLYRFFVFWVTFSLFFLSFIIMGARTHLIDFGWIIALGVALGIICLSDILSEIFRYRKTIMIVLVVLTLYSLVQANHVLWGRIYDKREFLIANTYAREVNQLEINDEDVIAVNIPGTEWAKLNYLINKSAVVFDSRTVERLIEEGKLADGFDKFRVRYIIGYSPELTEEILEQTDVKNIVSDDAILAPPETSKTKSWLMNLIR